MFVHVTFSVVNQVFKTSDVLNSDENIALIGFCSLADVEFIYSHVVWVSGR